MRALGPLQPVGPGLIPGGHEGSILPSSGSHSPVWPLQTPETGHYSNCHADEAESLLVRGRVLPKA